MEEMKQMLTAILDRLDMESAKNEAFRTEMREFQRQTKENFKVMQTQLDYVAGKIGEHDRDLHFLKQKQYELDRDMYELKQKQA